MAKNNRRGKVRTAAGKRKVRKVMREHHEKGTLRSSSGAKPTDAQARAIAMSEGRRVERQRRKRRGCKKH